MNKKYARLVAFLCLAAAPVGCGDDEGGGAPDASNIDAAPQPDSGPTAAACGVQVTDAFGALTSARVGLIVSFNRPDGSLIGTAFTDVDGKASREDCVPDTIVTTGGPLAVSSGPLGPPPTGLLSIYGVQPGDTVVIGQPAAPAERTSSAQLDIASNVSSNVDYLVYVGCNEKAIATGETATVPITSNCLGADGTTFDALAVARDNTSAEPYEIVGFSQATSIPFVENGDSPGTLDSWTTLPASPSVTVDVTNLPALSSSMLMTLSQRRDAVSFLIHSFNTLLSGDFQHVFSRALPLTFFDDQVLRLTVDFGQNQSLFLPPLSAQSQSIAAIGMSSMDAAAVDLSEVLLPRLATVVVTGPDGPARPVLTWLTDSEVEADAGAFLITFGADPPISDPRGYWAFLTAGVGEGTLQAPVLPDGLQPLAPRADESAPVADRGALFDSSWQDYADLITGGVDAFSLLDNEPPPPPVGDSLYRISRWRSAVVAP